MGFVSLLVVPVFALGIVAAIVYVWRHPAYPKSNDLRRVDDEPDADPTSRADLWVNRGARGG